ncbi:putative ribonuclease H protein [Glycine soja]
MSEDAAHLFFNCTKSLTLWWESLAWTGIVGAFPIIPRYHFLQHQNGMNGGKRNNRIEPVIERFGDKVNFWKDKWLGEDYTLQKKYNQVFVINEQQADLISMMGNFDKDSWRWNFKWRRNLFDYESDQAVNFMEEINSIHIQRYVKDVMLWKADPSGVYTTKSAYKLLITPSTPASDRRTSQLLWHMKIPPKDVVFTLKLLRDTLPTRANLSRRGVIIQDIACPLCGDEQEEVGHLFFNYKKIAMGPLPASPVDHFLQFCDGFGAEKNHSTCCGWWVALTSTIRKHRNFVIFQDKPFEPQKIMEDAMLDKKATTSVLTIGLPTCRNPLVNLYGITFLVGIAWAFSRAAPLVPCISYIQYHLVPRMVANKLIRIQRSFLWGGGRDNNKIAWISWKTVCLPKQKGGLGIKDIHTFNMALLGKWMWNLMYQQGALWVAILEAKYGGWRGLVEEGNSSCQSIWWRDLKKAIHMPYNGKTLYQQIKWKVECGDKYPRLYVNSNHQHQLVGFLGQHSNHGWDWNFSWRQQLFDSEIESAISFLSEVEGISINSQGSDTWVWTAEASGIFSTRSAYSSLWEEAAVDNLHECFEDLWKIKIPSKFVMFAWRTLWDRLPTKANLRARQVQISDLTCPFCRRVEENAPHIFIHCIKTQPIWWETMNWINMQRPLPWSIKDHFMQFSSLQVAGIRPRRWQWWWMAVTWSIWQLRNNIVFSNATFDGNKLVEDASFLLWTWLHNLEKDFSLHFNQWSSNLRQGWHLAIYRVITQIIKFLEHYSAAASKASNKRWTMWWVAATNSIWRLRNDMIFHNLSFDISKLTDSMLFLLWTWLRGLEKDFNTHFHCWSSGMSIAFIEFQRQFLWGGKPDSRKIAWISWSQCCSPKHMGGLGIRDLPSLNKALLFKWKWLMFHQPDQLWTRILISMYNGWRGLEYGPRKQYFSTWWADLSAIFQQQNVVSADNQIRWKLGRGDKFLFWEDPWGDEGVPLKDQFHELFSISSQRDLRVAEVGSWTENGWVWNMVWRRHLFDNEVKLASIFIDHIHQIRVNNNLNDTWVWGAESSGIFSTKFGYQVIKSEMVDEGLYLGFKKLWEIKLPPKALSFVWRLLWDKLPTKDNLIKRQIQVDNDLCPFCHNQPESASHLFFTCGKTMAIWWEYLSWVKEDKVFHCRPLDNFIQHYSSATSKVSNTRRTMWWIAATISIWRLRNDIIFQNQTFDINRLTDSTLC